MRLRTAHLVAALAVLPLSACSSASPAIAPSPASTSSTTPVASPSPTPTELGEVDSVTDLRDAAIAAGYVCPSWDQTNVIEKAAESGTCSDSDVFSTYSSEADRDAIIDFAKGSGLPDLSLLVGPNWIINGKDALGLQPQLGGTTVTAADVPTPDPEPSFDGKPADFKIGIKILKKKCFGSAGCNVTYRIAPEYLGTAEIPDEGTIEVTYAVKGFEDGEAVNTFTIEAGEASFDSEERGSVESSKTKLTGRVTDVSYSPGG